MSRYTEELPVVAEPFPGVEVLQAPASLSAGEFTELAATFWVPAHIDMSGNYAAAKPAELLRVDEFKRSPDEPRDAWAPDHHWHSDRQYWGENHFATVLYAAALEGEVAGTGIIDTKLLLEALEADMPGLTEELADSLTVFSAAKYFTDVLPKEATPESIQATIDARGVQTLGQVAVLEALKYPAKSLPTIPHYPWGGHSIMIDGFRAERITGLAPSRSQAIIDYVQRGYLNMPNEELGERPYFYHHHWEPGEVLTLTQVGTEHRADASPPDEALRVMRRTFIV